jgi:hypothetical protein
MQTARLLVGLLLLTTVTTAFAAVDKDVDAERVTLRQGAACIAHEDAGGATHFCYFDPAHNGKRDYSKSSGRAAYVFSELGQKCSEIELLGEVTQQRDGDELRRLAVQCIR